MVVYPECCMRGGRTGGIFLRDTLKRHPCRIGLNRAFLHNRSFYERCSLKYPHSAKKLPPETKHGKSGTGNPVAAAPKKIPPLLGKVKGNAMMRYYNF